jgi:hypothetical protein
MTLTIKSTDIWVVTSCCSDGAQGFGRNTSTTWRLLSSQPPLWETQMLHVNYIFTVQCLAMREASRSGKLSWARSLLGSLFEPEDRGDMFLRNVELSQKYTVLQQRRPYSKKQLFSFLRSMLVKENEMHAKYCLLRRINLAMTLGTTSLEANELSFSYPQSSSTLWNYSKCGVYTVESEAGC